MEIVGKQCSVAVYKCISSLSHLLMA